MVIAKSVNVAHLVFSPFLSEFERIFHLLKRIIKSYIAGTTVYCTSKSEISEIYYFIVVETINLLI